MINYEGPGHRIPRRFERPPRRGERLFVDCDNTIIVMWGDRSFTRVDGRRVAYRPCEQVIDFIHSWVVQEKGEVVIWSLASRGWAQEVVDHLLLSIKDDVLVWARYPRQALPGELYIDDDPFDSYRSACLNPQTLQPWQPVSTTDERIKM